MSSRLDRAEGALLGLAIGDALGMPTQLLSRARVIAEYGVISGFEPASAAHPIAAGMPAGSVTDDTHQALILARLLIAGGGTVNPKDFATALRVWEEEMAATGSLDLLGPSTRAALQALLDGVPPEESGREGVTNGAAMRVAPVGIAYPPRPLARLVRAVVDVDRVTHNTTIANAGASAVAAAVSVGVEGGSVADAAEAAVTAARLGGAAGRAVPGADVATRIAWACGLVLADSADPAGDHDVLSLVDRLVGTSMATQESVPAAFAILMRHRDDPWAACCAAASLGGDSDTIAAMAGAVAGACHGAGAFPREAVAALRRVNPGLGLRDLAGGLLTLRDSA